MRIKRTMCAGAVALAAIGGTASTFFHAAGTARAPEPARPDATMYSWSYTAPARYVSTLAPTTIVRLTSGWTSTSTSIPAGTPCTTSSSTLYNTSTVTTVVIRYGTLATCR